MAGATALLGVWAASSQGEAASRQAKNRCSDAVTILRQNGTLPPKGAAIDPTRVGGAVAAFKQKMEGFERAKKQIAQIPEAERDPRDPELVECFTLLDDWSSYLKDLKTSIMAAGQQSETLLPFLKEVKPHERAMLTLAAVAVEPKADPLGATKPAEAKKILADLALVEAACTKQMPDAGQQLPANVLGKERGASYNSFAGVKFFDSFTKDPNAWCYVAKNRVQLMAVGAANRTVIVEGYGNYAVVIPMTLKSMADGRPDMDAWLADMLVNREAFLKKQKTTAAAWMRDVGLPGAPADNSSLVAQLQVLQAKVDELAPTLKAPEGSHDGTIESGAKSSLKKIFPAASVHATSMDSAAWTVEKSAAGVPLNKFRSGQIVYKRPGSRWCEQRTFSYNETYTGGGTYGKGAGVDVLPATRFLACR